MEGYFEWLPLEGSDVGAFAAIDAIDETCEIFCMQDFADYFVADCESCISRSVQMKTGSLRMIL